DRPVRTFSNSDYMLFLTLHGAMHNWCRLFWLRDIAEIAVRPGFIRWQEVIAKAKEMNLMRTLSSGVILAGRLFGTDVPEELLYAFRKDRKSERIIRNASRTLAERATKKTELGTRLLGLSTDLCFRQGFRHKLKISLSFLTSYSDWELLPLPEKLFFLYYFLRPFLWLYRWGFGKKFKGKN
ncbi:MAG: nucleotidyltransferase family protein, partial [Bacteroidetes bacterium]|nr:nucleotidyltransferase family protein [Bacteroidota bacterium]